MVRSDSIYRFQIPSVTVYTAVVPVVMRKIYLCIFLKVLRSHELLLVMMHKGSVSELLRIPCLPSFLLRNGSLWNGIRCYLLPFCFSDQDNGILNVHLHGSLYLLRSQMEDLCILFLRYRSYALLIQSFL